LRITGGWALKFSTKIRIVVVGKMKNPFFRDAFEDYLRRAERFFRTEVVELRRGTYGTYGRVELERRKEWEQLRARHGERTFLVVLDEKGKDLSTMDLAGKLRELQERGYAEVLFFIGGPFGLAHGLEARADLLLSLSRLTLPYELARVMLMEQIYRCGTILSGENYHK
jgi:23S rRNA (pseudouridine1915-N3)-methyltransferase